MRISGADAAEAMARAGLLADSLQDLDLTPAGDRSPERPPSDPVTAPSLAPAEGPAWVAPGSTGTGVSRTWGMPDRQGRRKNTNPGVVTGDVSPLPDGVSGAVPRPTLSADSLPVAEPDASGGDGGPHGRPPNTLYASENSVPQGDPLMAALLEGIGTDEHPMPGPRIEPGLPPVRTTDPGVAAPSQRAPQRTGRVVPPHRGRRRQSTNTGRADPRGRQIATHPEELDTMRRSGVTDGNMPAVSISDEQPVGRISAKGLPTVDRVEVRPPPPVQSAGADTPQGPLAGYTPGPGPEPEYAPVRRGPPVPRASDWSESEVEGLDARRLFAIGTMLAALAISAVGASAGVQRMGHIHAIEAALDGGIGPNGPVPALPKDLDRVLDDRGLRSRVLAREQQIAGEKERFAISVELEQKVFGVPLSYHVAREGECDIGSMLATMDFYRSGGWEFDKNAEDRLAGYRAKNSSRVREATSRAKTPVLVEDSAAAVPTAEPEEGEEEGEGEGAEPAPTP